MHTSSILRLLAPAHAPILLGPAQPFYVDRSIPLQRQTDNRVELAGTRDFHTHFASHFSNPNFSSPVVLIRGTC